MLLAHLVAVVHAAVIVLMVTGALVALHRPRLLLVHAPVSLAILLVNRAEAHCPLTTLELWLRSRAGGPGYTGGFVAHYLVEPLGVDVASTATQTAIYALALLPNGLGYGLLAARALRARAEARGHGGPLAAVR